MSGIAKASARAGDVPLGDVASFRPRQCRVKRGQGGMWRRNNGHVDRFLVSRLR